MSHSYEEIRKAAMLALSGKEKTLYCKDPGQYEELLISVGQLLQQWDGKVVRTSHHTPDQYKPDHVDRELFLEVFWELFRQGIITLGLNDSNREFPYFRVSSFGRRILEGGDPYFFVDVSDYESTLKTEVPRIDPVTVKYSKEAMQAFRSGCLLSASVMLGVATEHTFLLLVETISSNPTHREAFKAVGNEDGILRKVNKFTNLLQPMKKQLPANVREDLETRFSGILATIRTFRNDSGHPSGNFINREQAYVLLQLFIAHCKKMYELMDYFSTP